MYVRVAAVSLTATATPASGGACPWRLLHAPARSVDFSDTLDDRRRSQRPSRAHRHQRSRAVETLEIVDGLDEQADARRTHRVAECDSSAVWIDTFHVEAGDRSPGQHDGGAVLVDLDDVDIAKAHP